MTVLLLCHRCDTVLMSDQDDNLAVSFDHCLDEHRTEKAWLETVFTDLMQMPNALLEKP